MTTAAAALDAHVRRIIRHHFSEDTGTPFWLDWAKKSEFSPIDEIGGYADLALFGHFDLSALRDAPHEQWIPRGLVGKPFCVFETGGTTGTPTQRLSWRDHLDDYTRFARELPDEQFPRGAAWLIVGPTGPRRLRISMEHLAQERGGHAYFVDVDPRWVRKRLAAGDVQTAKMYQAHVVEQAVTILRHREVQCMFVTPRLLEAIGDQLSLADAGVRGVLVGGTSMSPQTVRFLMEEILESKVGFTPVYGNTLMGVAPSVPVGPQQGFVISYYPPQPRAVVRVLGDDHEVVPYDERGRVELTTLTEETFLPRVLERDSAIRRRPHERYPWDGVADVQPLVQAGKAIIEGVY